MKSTQDENLAELTGIMFGDGCLSQTGGKYIVYISGHKIDDFEYHSKITKILFKRLFNKNIIIKFRNSENTLFIRFSDKEIFYRFKFIGMPVGRKYQNLTLPSMCEREMLFAAFMRGLFDTDGCIIFSKQHKEISYYPRIEISSESKSFLLEILERLRRKGFYGSVSNKGRGYRLELPGFKNLDSWLKMIGSHNPKHIMKIHKKLNSHIKDDPKNALI